MLKTIAQLFTTNPVSESLSMMVWFVCGCSPAALFNSAINATVTKDRTLCKEIIRPSKTFLFQQGEKGIQIKNKEMFKVV